MALQLNTQFTQFVQFARQRMEAGDTKSIARKGAGDSPLGGRLITAATGDKVAPFFGRSEANKQANNAARTAFSNAVVKMFGGEANIPESVKSAMKLGDYGKGRPLTARRIMAVARAITKESEELANQLKLAQAKEAALSAGYSMDELEKMEEIAGFYAEAAGCSELEAFKEVSTAGSKANRLMNYGGRFTENVQNFKDGLRLLDTFSDWFCGVADGIEKIGGSTGVRTDGMGKTMLNADTANFRTFNLRSVEKFAFEFLAHDASADLSETDGERVFGLERNPAMHFFGRGLNGSCTQTVAQIPPEKRALFYKAAVMFYPLAETAAHANDPVRDGKTISRADNTLVVARILKNFDKIAALESTGTLATANLARLCFPELPEDSDCTVADVRSVIDGIEDKMGKGLEEGTILPDQLGAIQNVMRETGCSFEEAVAAVKGGEQPPVPKYISSATLGLTAYDGTTDAGRAQLETDLVRPSGYTKAKEALLPPGGKAFKFRFPGEDPIAANDTEQGKAAIRTVIDKIENLCGKVHPAQATSVMALVSQSGLGILRGGLQTYGIVSTEHSACDFTLTRNADTGDVTIHYSSPEGLPFSFGWTATVKPDGYSTATPFQFLDAGQTAVCKAGVDDAVANMQDPKEMNSEYFVKDKANAVPLIETIMRASGGDEDVVALLKDSIVCGGILYNQEHELRTVEEILPRVAALKENVVELREATKDDPHMFKLGLSSLAQLAGKSVPKGTLAALVEAVRGADIGLLEKLSVSDTDTPAKLHTAVAQLHRAVVQSIDKSGIKAKLKGVLGGDLILGIKMLAAKLLTARLGKQALSAVKGVLESPVAGRLQTVYRDIGEGNFDGEGLSDNEKFIVQVTIGDLDADIVGLFGNVNEALGVEGDMPPPPEADDMDREGYREISRSVVDLTKELHSDLVENTQRQLERPTDEQGDDVIINP